jgi:TP901 family phage tail tape measure protein
VAIPEVGLKAVIENLGGFQRGAKTIQNAYDDINRKSGGVEKSSVSLSKQFTNLGQGVLGLGATMAKVAAGGVAALGAGLIALSVSGVKAATDFQSQMAILSTAVDPATASLEDLHDAALAVGADTDLVGVSASQAADAMTGLYKAGLTTNDIFGDLNGYLEGTADLSGALRAAVDLQAASELDLAGASDVVAVAMATFGLGAEDATRISDNFVQAADASVASVASLAEGMKNVGPTAASFGFSLEDTNNALAILSTRGISGAEAGTALKSMLTNIMRPTDQVKTALKELNVQLYDEQGAMLPLPQIVAQFSDSLEVGTSRTVTHAAATAEMKKQAEKATEQMVDLERKLVVAEAHTGMSADAMRDLMAQYVAANGSLEGFGRTQGGVTYELYKAVTAYDEAQGAIQQYKSAQGKTISETKTLTEEQRNQYVQTLAGTYGMKALQTLLDEGVDGWDAMAEATGAASSAGEIAKTRTDTFAGALEALEGTFETLKIGIGEAFLPVLTDLARQFADYINEYGPNLQATFQGVADWLAEKLPQGVALLSDLWATELQPALVATWQVIQTQVIPVLQEIWKWLGESLPKALAFVNEHWDAFKGALIAIGAILAGAAIAAAIGGIVAAIGALVSPIGLLVAGVALLGAAWNTNFLGIRDTLTAFWEETALPILTVLWQWLQTNVPLAIQFLTDTWNLVLLPALQAVWSFISEYIVPLLSALASVWLAIVEVEVKVLAGLWENVLLPALRSVWSFIQNNVIPILSSLANALTGVAGPAVDFLRDKVKSLADSFGSVKDAIKKAIKWLQDLADKIRSVDLPDWITGHSPPPLAFWFQDVADAVRQLSAVELPRLSASLDLSALPVRTAAPVTPALAAAGAMDTATTNNYFEMTVNTAATSGTVVQDFGIMRSLLGD